MRIPWIIDTDPGVDDAAAILTALRSGLHVVGITATYGNTTVDHAVRNALTLLDWLDVDVPVYRGAERALLRKGSHAAHVHGRDGFGDVGLPVPRRKPSPAHAVDVIIDHALRYHGELSILALGPLTNLALAIAKDRRVAHGIRQLIWMGGTSEAKGNATMVAEFNAFADPEAAAMVLGSGIPFTLVPWETTRKAVMPESMAQEIEAADSALGRRFLAVAGKLRAFTKKQSGSAGLDLCDLTAAALAIDPRILTEKLDAYITVETAGSLCRGMTVVDYNGRSGNPPNGTLCLDVAVERVHGLFRKALLG